MLIQLATKVLNVLAANSIETELETVGVISPEETQYLNKLSKHIKKKIAQLLEQIDEIILIER